MNRINDSPIGTSIAAVAVLLIQAERNAASRPYATRMRFGRPPMMRSDSTPNATRSLTRCTNSAWARMKLPTKRKIVGLANGRNVSPTGATCSSTASAGPSSAVTGSGSASVIQKTMTSPMTAASRCPSGDSDANGQASTRRNTSGPATTPVLRRDSSNRVSASVLVDGGRESVDICQTVAHFALRSQPRSLCAIPWIDPLRPAAHSPPTPTPSPPSAASCSTTRSAPVWAVAAWVKSTERGTRGSVARSR